MAEKFLIFLNRLPYILDSTNIEFNFPDEINLHFPKNYVIQYSRTDNTYAYDKKDIIMIDAFKEDGNLEKFMEWFKSINKRGGSNNQSDNEEIEKSYLLKKNQRQLEAEKRRIKDQQNYQIEEEKRQLKIKEMEAKMFENRKKFYLRAVERHKFAITQQRKQDIITGRQANEFSTQSEDKSDIIHVVCHPEIMKSYLKSLGITSGTLGVKIEDTNSWSFITKENILKLSLESSNMDEHNIKNLTDLVDSFKIGVVRNKAANTLEIMSKKQGISLCGKYGSVGGTRRKRTIRKKNKM